MNKTENIHKHDFTRSFFEFLPYIIMDFIGAFGGFFGNILIIGSISFTKELHSMTSAFILNLAIADCFLSTVLNGLSIVGK